MFAATSDALTISSSDAVLVVSVIGTVAFALSGVMAATEAGMDWLGGVVLAAVAATYERLDRTRRRVRGRNISAIL